MNLTTRCAFHPPNMRGTVGCRPSIAGYSVLDLAQPYAIARAIGTHAIAGEGYLGARTRAFPSLRVWVATPEHLPAGAACAQWLIEKRWLWLSDLAHTWKKTMFLRFWSVFFIMRVHCSKWTQIEV